jgi:hypothetical protein
MQKGDKKDTKMATPVEIVDAPPRVADNETYIKNKQHIGWFNEFK